MQPDHDWMQEEFHTPAMPRIWPCSAMTLTYTNSALPWKGPYGNGSGWVCLIWEVTEGSSLCTFGMRNKWNNGIFEPLCWGAALPWHPKTEAETTGEPQTHLHLPTSLCFSSGTQFLNQDWAFPTQWKIPAVLFHSASHFSQAICLDFVMRTVWLDLGWHQASSLNQHSLKNASAQKADLDHHNLLDHP